MQLHSLLIRAQHLLRHSVPLEQPPTKAQHRINNSTLPQQLRTLPLLHQLATPQVQQPKQVLPQGLEPKPPPQIPSTPLHHPSPMHNILTHVPLPLLLPLPHHQECYHHHHHNLNTQPHHRPHCHNHNHNTQPHHQPHCTTTVCLA